MHYILIFFMVKMFSSFTNGHSDISQNESLSRRCNNNLRKKCISLGMSTSTAIIIIAKKRARNDPKEYDVRLKRFLQYLRENGT